MFKLGMLKLLENVIVSHKMKLDLFTAALQGKVPPGFFHHPRSIFTRIYILPPVGKKGKYEVSAKSTKGYIVGSVHIGSVAISLKSYRILFETLLMFLGLL